MIRIERRVVSVVFADLVGFTGLSERLDPEDVAGIQEAYFARAEETVTSHGGRTEKYIGDAVMATFGVAAATDEDAVHAVRAATQLVVDLREVETGLGLAAGALDLRVGVNTGEVVVTRRGADWRVTGDVVNTAARLQAAAAPGEVLLGPETAFGIAHAYAVEPAGEISLKGKAHPVRAWRPGRPRPAARGLATHGLRAPTLGREAPLAELLALLTGAAPAATAVVAPPGVGKSRLVEELAARAEAAGHPTLLARVPPAGEAYAPVAQLLRRALDHAGAPIPTTPDGATALVDRLTTAGFAPAHAETTATHTADLLAARPLRVEPADLFASWAAVLDLTSWARVPDGATKAPLWVVEDVHLAGPDLRGFLGHVLAHPGTRGLLVLTARPDATLLAGGPLADVPVLALPPLDAAATRHLVTALIGRGTVPAHHLAALVGASGGNPLFVEELLRSWILAGVLVASAGRWALTGPARGGQALPSTVHAIYQAQLDRLTAGPRAVVETGSVPGTTFPSAALPTLGIDDAAPALHLLTQVGLLSGPHADVVDPVSFTYRHAVLRDTAYASLGRLRRAQLHARFAGWLQPDGPAELVGRHLALACRALPETAATLDDRPAADLAADAARWLERGAAEQRRGSPQRAASLLGEALDVAPHAPAEDRLRRTLRRGEALRRAGRLEEAMRDFRDAGTLARAGQRPDDLLTAALGYEQSLFASRLPRSVWGEDSVALLRAALAHLGSSDVGPAPRARVRATAALGRALVYAGQRGAGVDAGTVAVRLAEESGDPVAIAEAHLALRAAHDRPECLPERLAGIRRAVEAASGTPDDELRFEAARLELIDALEAGDLARADRAQADATALVLRLGRPLHLWYPPMWQAMRALLAGDHAAAGRLVAGFAEQGRRVHYRDVEQVVSLQLLELHLATGTPAPVLDRITAEAEADPDRWTFAVAAVRARLHDDDGARRALRHYADDDFARVAADLSWSTTMAYLAEVAGLVGGREVCARIAELLRPWQGHVVVTGSGALCLGSVDHYLGLVLRGAGERGAAVHHLRAAVERNDALRARALATRSRAELARTLHLTGATADAAAVRARAAADARTLGMPDPIHGLERA
ncbi:adenylate/guanylate cyclase domain-containing protein [Georgenia yuyongxinii]